MKCLLILIKIKAIIIEVGICIFMSAIFLWKYRRQRECSIGGGNEAGAADKRRTKFQEKHTQKGEKQQSYKGEVK